jgi:hypothetical protein
MPAISIKGTTKNVTGRKEGSNIVIEKTIQGGTLIETYAGKRANGKQAPGAKMALSAVEIENILAGNKNDMNSFANKVMDKEVKKHKKETTMLDTRVKTLTNKLAAVKQARKAESTDQMNTMTARAEKAEKDAKQSEKERKGFKNRAIERLEKAKVKTTRLRTERDDLKTEVAKLKAGTPSGTKTPEAGPTRAKSEPPPNRDKSEAPKRDKSQALKRDKSEAPKRDKSEAPKRDKSKTRKDKSSSSMVKREPSEET